MHHPAANQIKDMEEGEIQFPGEIEPNKTNLFCLFFLGLFKTWGYFGHFWGLIYN